MAASERREEGIVTGYSGRVLVTFSVGYMLFQFGRNIIPPLLPAITSDLGITPFLAGIALTALNAANALSMYPGGRFADESTRKTVLVGGMSVLILGLVMLTSSLSYLMFLGGVVTLGFGGGLYWISLRGLLADLFVRRRGQAFGIQEATGFTGSLIAAGVSIYALQMPDWRVVFPGVILLFLVFLALAHQWIEQPYHFPRVDFEFTRSVRRIFAERKVTLLLVAYVGMVFSMQSMIGFLPTLLQAEKAVSPTVAGIGFGVLFTGAMVTMPISGYLGDRLSHLPMAVGGLLVSAVSLLVVLLSSDMFLVVPAIFFYGVGIWAFPPVVQAYLMTHFPEGSMAGDIGMIKMIYVGIGGIGPAYIGFVAGMSSYHEAFSGLLLVLTVSALLVVWVMRSEQ